MFQGFTPETIDFLWGIRMNNNREWFQAHKQAYVTQLYEPMKALGAELFQPFAQQPGNILKVSRIYRDARMHHPLPYKETLYTGIRKNVDEWCESPCLYAEIGPDGISYGLLMWRPSPAYMERFRREIQAHPDDFLKLLDRTEKACGIPVTARCYKRPRPAEDPRLAPFFAWKDSICCIREEPVAPELFGPELGSRIAELLGKLTELYEFFGRFLD